MVRTTISSRQREALTDALTSMNNRRRLERGLARALEDVGGGAGSAYRLGGGEFRALLPDREDAEERLARTDAALAEAGDGFAISAARAPCESRRRRKEAEEAMHLADRRMYAAKLGGRSDGDDTVAALVHALHETKSDTDTRLDEVALLVRDVARRLRLTPEEIDEVVRRQAA
jgi:GGDEF domain-containing protein